MSKHRTQTLTFGIHTRQISRLEQQGLPCLYKRAIQNQIIETLRWKVKMSVHEKVVDDISTTYSRIRLLTTLPMPTRSELKRR
jgi:hypothetical protein